MILLDGWMDGLMILLDEHAIVNDDSCCWIDGWMYAIQHTISVQGHYTYFRPQLIQQSHARITKKNRTDDYVGSFLRLGFKQRPFLLYDGTV